MWSEIGKLHADIDEQIRRDGEANPEAMLKYADALPHVAGTAAGMAATAASGGSHHVGHIAGQAAKAAASHAVNNASYEQRVEAGIKTKQGLGFIGMTVGILTSPIWLPLFLIYAAADGAFDDKNDPSPSGPNGGPNRDHNPQRTP